MSELEFHPTEMRATVSFDVAVVRASGRRRCAQCGRRRVCMALSATSAPIGNPETPWKCLTCWGLR